MSGRFPGSRSGRRVPAAPGPPALPARWEPRSALPAPSGGRGRSRAPPGTAGEEIPDFTGKYPKRQRGGSCGDGEGEIRAPGGAKAAPAAPGLCPVPGTAPAGRGCPRSARSCPQGGGAARPWPARPGDLSVPIPDRRAGGSSSLPAGLFAGTVNADGRSHRALPPQAPKAEGRDSFHSQPEGTPGQVPQTWAESLGCRAACPLAECRGDAAAFLTPVFPQTVQPCWNKRLQPHGSGLQSRALSLGSVLTLRQQLPEPCSAPSRVPGPWIIRWYVLRAGELRI